MSFFAIDTPKAMRYDPPQGFRAQAATVLSKFGWILALELDAGFWSIGVGIN
jgi:hypothetical protein